MSRRKHVRSGCITTVVRRRETIKPDGTRIVDEAFATPDWRADAWYLLRVLYERYGRKDKSEIDAKLKEIGIDGTLRSEALSLQQHLELSAAFG